jgi:hypothetical protein
VKDFSEARDKLKGLKRPAPTSDGTGPKPSDVAPEPVPEGAKRAHPDQLFPDVEPFKMPNFSPEGEEPKINHWLSCGDMFACFVDGAMVRDKIHIDYVEGGHFLRYGWIPEDQIWIEDILSRLDQCSTVIHEAHEHYLMSQGGSYEDSHASASKTERVFRNMAIEKGTILPSDIEMEKLVTLELNGASCLELAKEIMEKASDPVSEWVRTTG